MSLRNIRDEKYIQRGQIGMKYMTIRRNVCINQKQTRSILSLKIYMDELK